MIMTTDSLEEEIEDLI